MDRDHIGELLLPHENQSTSLFSVRMFDARLVYWPNAIGS